ncbi:hypothetical protein IW262DRAFT_1301338 [Armillaria fumosa]|nr:hypothetical protein IW262DRAFT_1301338 [Armillaria fumosa]
MLLVECIRCVALSFLWGLHGVKMHIPEAASTDPGQVISDDVVISAEAEDAMGGAGFFMPTNPDTPMAGNPVFDADRARKKGDNRHDALSVNKRMKQKVGFEYSDDDNDKEERARKWLHADMDETGKMNTET